MLSQDSNAAKRVQSSCSEKPVVALYPGQEEPSLSEEHSLECQLFHSSVAISVNVDMT